MARGSIVEPTDYHPLGFRLVDNSHVGLTNRVPLFWAPCARSRYIGRYDPLEIEPNNRLYLSKGEVPASDEVRELAWSLHEAGDEADARKQPPPPPPPPPSPLQLPKGFL